MQVRMAFGWHQSNCINTSLQQLGYNAAWRSQLCSLFQKQWSEQTWTEEWTWLDLQASCCKYKIIHECS